MSYSNNMECKGIVACDVVIYDKKYVFVPISDTEFLNP